MDHTSLPLDSQLRRAKGENALRFWPAITEIGLCRRKALGGLVTRQCRFKEVHKVNDGWIRKREMQLSATTVKKKLTYHWPRCMVILRHCVCFETCTAEDD